MMIWFAIMLSVVGVIIALTPIVWMFLRLAGKIGPEEPGDAGALGIVLFIACWAAAAFAFVGVARMLHLPF